MEGLGSIVVGSGTHASRSIVAVSQQRSTYSSISVIEGGFCMPTTTLRSVSARSRVISEESARVGDRRVSTISQQPEKPWALHTNRTREKTMKTLGWTVRSSLVVLLAATSTSWAQGPPPPTICGQVATASGDSKVSVSGCMGELLTAQLAMIVAVEGVVNEMHGMNLSAFGAERFGLRKSIMEDDLKAKIQFLHDEHDRALAANEVVEDDDYEEAFAKADQDKGKKCTFSDMPFKDSLDGDPPPGLQPVTDPRFGNNRCDIFDAVDLDDNDVRVNERKENMCERVCADRQNPNGSGARKEERKIRVALRLTDGIAATHRATARISEASANLASLRLQLSSAASRSSGPSDICVSGFDLPAVFEIAATSASLANIAVAFVTAGLEVAKDNVKPAANQTVAGFNVGSTVIPFALVAGLSKMLEEVIAAVEKGLVLTAQIVSAFREDTLEVCLGSVRDTVVNVRDDTVMLKGEFEGPDGAIFKLQEDVDDLQVKAGDTNDALAAIREELALMKTLLEANRDLLLTPLGRRGGFKP